MSARLVPGDAVRPRLDPSHFPFETTDDVTPLRSVGEAAMRLQPRARAAFDVAVAARAPGFHVFASGSPHLVKLDAVLAQLQGASATLPRASDWAYVFNEDQPERPLPLRLQPGEGKRYAAAVADAVARVHRELQRVLQGGRLRRRRAVLEEDTHAAEKEILAQLKQQLRQRHFDVRRFEGQLEAVPFWKGKAVTKPLATLPAAARKLIEAHLPELSELVEEGNRKLGELRAGFFAKLADLHREVALDVVTRALAPVERDFHDPEPLAHLARLRRAMVTQHPLFLDPEEDAQGSEDRLLRFAVHVLVTHEGEAGAPVVKEGNPTTFALFGTTSREVVQGVLTTDFTHLRPGALHRANGGFLVLPARAVLAQPEVWAALKRTLRTREIHPEEGELAQGNAVQPLNPDPIPLECSVVLTGEVELFAALYEQDPDFRELFGVRADFSDTTTLDTAALVDATGVVAALVREEHLLPFDTGGVARTLEYSLRLAGDQQRLSLEWDRLRLLLVEASHEAKRDASPRVRAVHVRRAEEAAAWRSGLHREHLADEVRRGLLRLQVTGTAPGQVNALALSMLGDSVVGRAARVSARVGPGTRGLVDIEHRAELSGPVHAKAVMQLQGYLLGRFGGERPLAFDGTLTFEQSYFAVEGDSASVAELVALVSALTGAPVRQGLAVSCSLGQDGAAQVVGGITDKVEGFFEACKLLGLDGTQGVILAANNVQHLVLRDEVVEAIERGRFHLHAIEHSDDALELLLGLPRADVDARVARRLDAFARAMRALREVT
ncbi:MAG: AAA family ATPase [Archangium sp.]|nr:AAA family ATPase [Archangium sp.]